MPIADDRKPLNYQMAPTGSAISKVAKTAYSQPTCASFIALTRGDRKIHCSNTTAAAVTMAARIDDAERAHEVKNEGGDIHCEQTHPVL